MSIPRITEILETTGIDVTLQVSTTPISTDYPLPTYNVAYSTILQGNITLTSATPTVLSADTDCKVVTIQAHPANSAYVYVGTVDVSSTVHMFVLSAGSSISFTVSNLNLLYVDGTTADKVSYGGEN